MPTAHLEIIDWVVIGGYFVSLLAIGLYYRRFANRSLDDYFMAGRRNSGWANGVSYAAAMMNADVAPAYSGFTVATGVFVSWFYLSRFGIALFLGAMLFAVFWRRLNLFTTPEFYELRFGGLASNIIRTWVALKSSLLAMVAWTGTGLVAMYKIAGPVLGIDKTTTMLIVIPIVLVYVGTSGFSGVVATASVQSLIMFIGSAMLCGIVLYAMGGPVSLAEQVHKVAGAEALQAIPPSSHWFFPLAAALAWMLGTSIGYGGDTAPLGGAMEGQCVLSSKNPREASKMYVVAEITLFVLLLMVTLPSLGAMVEWPALRLPKEDPLHIDREMAYGLLMGKYLPPGMLGLLFVVMLAAVMSTIGSNLIFGAQLMVNDVYRRYLRPSESDRHYMMIGRFAIGLILVLALIVAYQVNLIFDVAAFMVAASASELSANWAQWWWWRFNRWGRLSASFGGIILPVLIWFVLPTSQWPWWERTYLAMGLNTALWIVVTLMTSPDSPEILDRFYRKGRPLGLWTPVRKRVELESPAMSRDQGGASRSGVELILLGIALALLGAGSVMCLVQGLSFLYVARYAVAVSSLFGFVVTGVLFLKSYGPYLDRLETWAPMESPSQPQAEDMPTNSGGHATQPPPVAMPKPTSVVVAIATVAYGVLIIFGGVIWTRGADLAFNLVAGGLFLISALVVWWLGGAWRNIE